MLEAGLLLGEAVWLSSRHNSPFSIFSSFFVWHKSHGFGELISLTDPGNARWLV